MDTTGRPAPTGTLVPGGVVALTIVFAVPAGLLCYSYGFLRSYFMRDQVDVDNHVRFLTIGLVACAVTWCGSFAVARRLRPRPVRPVVAALLVSAVPHLLFAAVFGYFTTAYETASPGLAALFGGSCLVAAALAASRGWRLLRQ